MKKNDVKSSGFGNQPQQQPPAPKSAEEVSKNLGLPMPQETMTVLPPLKADKDVEVELYNCLLAVHNMNINAMRNSGMPLGKVGGQARMLYDRVNEALERFRKKHKIKAAA